MNNCITIAGTPRVSASQSHALNQVNAAEMDQMDPITLAMLIALGVKVGVIDLVSP